MVGASSALILAYGIGAAAGPTLTALTMQLLGPVGFPLFLAVVHLAIGLFALYRMTRRATGASGRARRLHDPADALPGGRPRWRRRRRARKALDRRPRRAPAWCDAG